ncbi:MAG: thiol-disulfide oxidoreductase DCC family protein [Hyphomicrobium sp.]|nr:thiol-disulfide oxidoreductase DCC family protein [Hyphomicrobium sp.]
MPSPRDAYSYRQDAAVPRFADDKPVIIFDGHCVLCSGWAMFVVRHDRQARFRLLPAQSPLGSALYQHFGLDPVDYETNILIADGRAWVKSEGSIRMFEGLGFPWSLAAAFRILPLGVRDRGYELLARNRFRIFGRRDVCFAPDASIKDRFLA